ncbi:MAG: conjugal transfer protein TraR [Halioglobus sp.]|nr:conjugal transfer protein TraR [Halioglobus sp.]
MSLLLLLAGLVLLLGGGTALVSAASSLAARHGVSPLIVGMTVVAFGTSAPELVVNVIGALRGSTDLAFGNVAGSNIANLGLVLGLAALIRPVSIQGQVVRRELPLLLLGTLMVLVMTLDRWLLDTPPQLTRSEGLVLLLLFTVFLYFTIGDLMNKQEDPLLGDLKEMEDSIPSEIIETEHRDWLWCLGGIVALGLGGHLTIVHGGNLAQSLGVPPVIIGLFVVAVGTSLPELACSVIAALRREADLCVGNVIGSNIFNFLAVLPISAVIRPLPIPGGGILDLLVSLGFAAAIVPVFIFRNARMGRVFGLLFLSAYLLYVALRLLA